MMKRVFLTFAILTTLLTVQAQDYLGIQLGYARPITRLNAPVMNTDKALNASAYNGFKVGLVYDATIVKGFGVSMGLNYTFAANKTDKVSATSVGLYPQLFSRGQYHQIEIPIDWQYKFEIAKRTWLLLYTGPTLQCGLAFNQKGYLFDGKQELPDNQGNKSFYSQEDMNDYALKRLNVTWGVGAGFQYERYFLRGGYDFGLINPYKAYQFTEMVNDGNPRTRGRFDQWQIKLGIYFWESKK
jgi:hypothetical protein